MGNDSEAILKNVTDSFYRNYNSNKKISSLYKKVRDGTATYDQANQFAIELGNILAKSYKLNIPIEAMTYDQAMELLTGPLGRNYTLISTYCADVQTIMNKKNKMNVNPVTPKQNIDRVNGLAKAVSNATDVEQAVKYFEEAVINYSQSIVDDAIHDNAQFYDDLGFKPQIIREYEGPHDERGYMVDCEWCLALAGTYDYEDVKSGGSEVYKRHEGCRCTLTFVSSKGTLNKMNKSGNAFVR